MFGTNSLQNYNMPVITGDLPDDLKYQRDPQVQCATCGHCHEVELYNPDGRTIRDRVFICTDDAPVHIVDVEAWHDEWCGYDGDERR